MKNDGSVSLHRIPTPDELAHHPELALLHALDAILDLVPRALVAAHPELGDPDAPSWARENSRSVPKPDPILATAHRLQRYIRAYRRAITRAQDQRLEPDPDIPF